jgi:hypothetical protein
MFLQYSLFLHVLFDSIFSMIFLVVCIKKKVVRSKRKGITL